MTVIWKLKEEITKIPKERPYVILNAAMTLDGKIATRLGDSRISCLEDLKRVHILRASVDAVMVGINTVLKDNPKLTVRLVKGRNPLRIVVDSLAKIPLDANVISDKSTSTIIAVTEKAPAEKIDALRSAGAEIIIAGSGPRVDLKLLMKRLRERNIRKLLLEGGGELNWSMLRNRLVDEIRIAIAPIIVGGRNAVTLVGGEGVARVDEGIKLKLICIEQYGEDLVLTYQVASTQSCF